MTDNNTDNTIEIQGELETAGTKGSLKIKKPTSKIPFFSGWWFRQSQKSTIDKEEEYKQVQLDNKIRLDNAKTDFEIMQIENQIKNENNTKAVLNHVENDLLAYTTEEQEQFINQDRSLESEDIIRELFNNSSKSSEQHFHMLYAKLIMGEMKQPNSVSRKTLNIVSNLSTEVIELFKSILPYVIHTDFHYIILKNDPDYTNILLLTEYELLSYQQGKSLTTAKNKPAFYLNYFNNIIIPDTSCDEIGTPITLTKSAIQLYNLLSDTIQQLTIDKLSTKLKTLLGAYTFTIANVDSIKNENFLNNIETLFPNNSDFQVEHSYIKNQLKEYQRFQTKQQGE